MSETQNQGTGSMIKADICVIGAGSGGLSVAAGASQMGADVVLVEKGKMGGDCLNYGCVPSKALLAAGKQAHAMRHGTAFGIDAVEPTINHQAVYDHVQNVIGAIAPNDSVERLEGLGVNVVQGTGHFVDRQTLAVGETRIKARRFVVATGSRASVPPIPGLDDVPYHTNETIFSAEKFPVRLIIIGGGPIGCEMAQAHRHLAAEVTVLELFTIMPKDDPELVDVVRRSLVRDGVDLREGVSILRVEKTPNGVAVIIKMGEQEERIDGTDLMLATGRAANVNNLGMEAAGISYSPKGIDVDRRLRTTNRKIFAIGDCTGGPQFTHVAGYHAGIVIRNALFRLPAKADHRVVPWVTYTSPELAQVGMTEADARKIHGGDIRILRWPFFDNDRAQAQHQTDGLIKAIVTPKGHILGVGIAGANAGELIQTWVLAMTQKAKIGSVASMIAPYPTLGEISKRAAGSFYTPKLFSERTKSIVRFLARFG